MGWYVGLRNVPTGTPAPPRHSNYLGSGSPDGPGQVVKFDGYNTIAAAAAGIVHVLYSIIASGTTIDKAPANEQIEEALNWNKWMKCSQNMTWRCEEYMYSTRSMMVAPTRKRTQRGRATVFRGSESNKESRWGSVIYCYML